MKRIITFSLLAGLVLSACGTEVTPSVTTNVTESIGVDDGALDPGLTTESVITEISSIAEHSSGPLTKDQEAQLAALGAKLHTEKAHLDSVASQIQYATFRDDGTYESKKGFNEMLIQAGAGGAVLTVLATAAYEAALFADLGNATNAIKGSLENSKVRIQKDLIKRVRNMSSPEWSYVVERPIPGGGIEQLRKPLAYRNDFATQLAATLERYYAGGLSAVEKNELYAILHKAEMTGARNPQFRAYTLADFFRQSQEALTDVKREMSVAGIPHYQTAWKEQLKAKMRNVGRVGLGLTLALGTTAVVLDHYNGLIDLRIKQVDGKTVEQLRSDLAVLQPQYDENLRVYNEGMAKLNAEGRLPKKSFWDSIPPIRGAK